MPARSVVLVIRGGDIKSNYFMNQVLKHLEVQTVQKLGKLEFWSFYFSDCYRNHTIQYVHPTEICGTETNIMIIDCRYR